MSDLAVTLTDNFELDLIVSDNDLKKTDGLKSAMFGSLLSWAYDSDTDSFPWGGDSIFDTDVKFGSKLYLLFNETINDNTINLCKIYIADALQWMIDDGVVNNFDISVSRYDTKKLYFTIVASRPSGTSETFEYYLNWESQMLETE